MENDYEHNGQGETEKGGATSADSTISSMTSTNAESAAESPTAPYAANQSQGNKTRRVTLVPLTRTGRVFNLSDRELRVVQLLCNLPGFPSDQVAAILVFLQDFLCDESETFFVMAAHFAGATKTWLDSLEWDYVGGLRNGAPI